MPPDQESHRRSPAGPGDDRRSGGDRRQIYDLDYFERGGLERRKSEERRTGLRRFDPNRTHRMHRGTVKEPFHVQ